MRALHLFVARRRITTHLPNKSILPVIRFNLNLIFAHVEGHEEDPFGDVDKVWVDVLSARIQLTGKTNVPTTR